MVPPVAKVYALAPERYTQLIIYCLASFMCPMMWSILVRHRPRQFSPRCCPSQLLQSALRAALSACAAPPPQAPIYTIAEAKFDVGTLGINALSNVRRRPPLKISRGRWKRAPGRACSPSTPRAPDILRSHRRLASRARSPCAKQASPRSLPPAPPASRLSSSHRCGISSPVPERSSPCGPWSATASAGRSSSAASRSSSAASAPGPRASPRASPRTAPTRSSTAPRSSGPSGSPSC